MGETKLFKTKLSVWIQLLTIFLQSFQVSTREHFPRKITLENGFGQLRGTCWITEGTKSTRLWPCCLSSITPLPPSLPIPCISVLSKDRGEAAWHAWCSAIWTLLLMSFLKHSSVCPASLCGTNLQPQTRWHYYCAVNATAVLTLVTLYWGYLLPEMLLICLARVFRGFWALPWAKSQAHAHRALYKPMGQDFCSPQYISFNTERTIKTVPLPTVFSCVKRPLF